MAGIRTENKIYEVGIYCRLSKDDGTDNESASIATQKSILTDYVKRQGWHLAKTYVDDGYSGTNFQRPSFQNMIKDIENGLINCVITKDLSRLGRNYLDCGLYLEVFFPEHNVRYIAVNDGVDTLNKSAMDITPFRNILNEMYSADVSVKIKSAYRARFQQGKFMGTTAPYGYVKDPADHNHLLIDDKVAHVVREIFDLALAGNGIAKIRKHINKQHILRPAAYAVEQGATGYERYFEDNEENRYIWSENSVRGILRSPIYAGNLAGYKRIAANMKSKKRPSKLPEEWEVIPDTHEGIVTQEEFDTVQQLMTSRRREQNAGGFENIFSGVIKCADCGYAMRAASANRRKRPDIIDCVQYTCNNYGRYGNVMCTAHSIEARDLFNAVLADINRFADMAVNDEKAVRAIERRLTETDQSRAKSLEKEKKKLNKRLAELDRLFSSLYEDKVMERITERNFEMMSGKYQKEQLEIEARLKEVTETLNDSYEKSQGVRDFLSLIRNYQGLKELDATIINALIDKILVSEREKLADGTVRQEIKIYYKFIGFVGELHITPTKRWTALKPKNCTVCGVEYVPSSGISKYCPACAKRIQREKSNESKRRSRERNRRACIELSAKNDRLMLVALVNYLLQILTELIKLAMLVTSLNVSYISAKRVQEIFDLKEEDLLEALPVETARVQEAISAQKVSFTYPTASNPALENISFDLDHGQMLGIIGGTGSGKSTLVQLLSHLYAVSQGKLALFHQGHSPKTLKEWREWVALVPQKAELFRGTIRSNLLLGMEENLSDDDLWWALETAQAADFVREKEGQLDEPVEAFGRNFSGGQRQRLTIARALLKKAPFLILDDSTSALDYLTEARLLKSIKEELSDTSFILVSQRTNSLKSADQILVLNKGHQVGLGNHDFLLSTNEIYQEIHESQHGREEA